MTWVEIVTRFWRSSSRARAKPMVYLAIATTAFRVTRKLLAREEHSVLSFEVKAGEAYEIRGVTRGE